MMKTNASYENTPQLVTIRLFAMGCHIQISLNTTKLARQHSQMAIEQQVAALTQNVQQRLAHWQQLFSRFDESSELMRLNNRGDQWVEVSAELFEVLQRAMHFVSKTQGLITPTLLKELWSAGYKYSFETLPKISTPSVPIGAASAKNVSVTFTSNLQDVPSTNHGNPQTTAVQLRQLVDGRYQVYLAAGVALDLNGYVKGWCAMQLAEQISQIHDWQFPCLVDMGGDIAIGVPKDSINKPLAWGVAIAKPYVANSEHMDNDEDVAILTLDSGAVATSGQDYRRWWHDGRWQHHLIHPHYSCPATSDVLTATILAKDTLTAEVYAKYCVLLGVTAALAWLKKHHIAALLIDTNNQVIATSAMYPNLASAQRGQIVFC